MSGFIQNIGGFLFGDAGENKFKPTPYSQNILHRTDDRNFILDQSAKDEAKKELERNRATTGPQLSQRTGKVNVSGYSPTEYGGASIGRSGFNSLMSSYGSDAANADRVRRQQIGDLGLMREAATGNAPSVAEQQLQAGMDRSIAAQAAAAASARGGAGAQAAARRQSAILGAQTRAETNQQAAALRAGEIANARQNLLAGGQALRAGDINQQGITLNAAQTALQPEIAQAELTQQANLQNQQLATQAGMQGVGLQTQADMQAKQIQNQVDLANLQAAIQSKGLSNQYNLGLMGQIADVNKTQLGANMGYEDLMNRTALGYEGLNQNAWATEQQLRAGSAAQSAQANLMTGTAGLGFIGGLASSYIGSS